MNAKNKVLLPLIMVFIVLSGFLLVSKNNFIRWGIDREVLLMANLLFFLMSVAVFIRQRKAMQSSNPNVFVRSVMGAMLIKMLICITAVVSYILLSGKSFNKPAVYLSMLIYVIYLAVEVGLVMKLNKRKDA